MKISIVIPVYNEAENLADCLEAIAAQTVRPREVIVVDNGSTDNSVKIAESFEFVQVIREPKRGIVHARDRGYNAARGEIIARIDADSLVPSDWLARISEFYSHSDSAHLAFTGGANFYNVRMPRAVAWLYNLLAFDLNRLLIGHPTLWGSNMALTRSQWLEVRRKVCRRTGIHEDLDLSMHLYASGYKIYYDRRFRINAHLNRVRSNRHELWEYLQWWPRTLKAHRRRTWVIAWLFGAAMLYLLTPLLNTAESMARWAGLTPVPEAVRAE